MPPVVQPYGAPQPPEPYGAPPPYWSPGTPPPSSSGNRTLIIVLVVVVAALILMTGVAAAFLIARGSESTTSSSFTIVTEAPPTTSVDAETTESTDSATTTTEAVELSSGQWVDTTVPQPPGESYAVAVSDEYLVISADSGLYAYSLVAKGELIKIDSSGTDAGSPTLDGSLLAWWEGSYDETSYEFVDMAIFAKRLPDGDRVEVVPYDRAPSYPQLSNGYLTWTQGSPDSGTQDSEVWQYPIYGVPVDAKGVAQGEPDLLTNAPRAYTIGDATWSYSFSGTWLAWEQQQEAEGLAAGVHLMDLRSGETRQLGGEGAGRPSISGDVVVFRADSLQALDIQQDRQWTVDPSGDWPVTTSDFVVYLRAVEGDTPGWNIVVRSLTSDVERIIGTQTTPPWLSSPIAASNRHIAWVADDGSVKLFEWQQ